MLDVKLPPTMQLQITYQLEKNVLEDKNVMDNHWTLGHGRALASGN